MKFILLLTAVVFLSACTSGDKKKNATTDKIIEERINGPANIRDTIGGKILFRLDDNVRVSCTPLQNNWYTVGIMMDIDTSEFGNGTLKKGRKILVSNMKCGDILSNMEVSTSMGRKEAWAHLIGYTHKDNIKPETIIENVLKKQLADNKDRRFKSLKHFINNFDLEKYDQFDGYMIYYNYENWIEDPSPMWRIGLVFQNDLLIGILHSRPLTIPGTKNYLLDRGFDCLLYNDTKRKENLAQIFNKFVNKVD